MTKHFDKFIVITVPPAVDGGSSRQFDANAVGDIREEVVAMLSPRAGDSTSSRTWLTERGWNGPEISRLEHSVQGSRWLYIKELDQQLLDSLGKSSNGFSLSQAVGAAQVRYANYQEKRHPWPEGKVSAGSWLFGDAGPLRLRLWQSSPDGRQATRLERDPLLENGSEAWFNPYLIILNTSGDDVLIRMDTDTPELDLGTAARQVGAEAGLSLLGAAQGSDFPILWPLAGPSSNGRAAFLAAWWQEIRHLPIDKLTALERLIFNPRGYPDHPMEDAPWIPFWVLDMLGGSWWIRDFGSGDPSYHWVPPSDPLRKNGLWLGGHWARLWGGKWGIPESFRGLTMLPPPKLPHAGYLHNWSVFLEEDGASFRLPEQILKLRQVVEEARSELKVDFRSTLDLDWIPESSIAVCLPSDDEDTVATKNYYFDPLRSRAEGPRAMLRDLADLMFRNKRSQRLEPMDIYVNDGTAWWTDWQRAWMFESAGVKLRLLKQDNHGMVLGRTMLAQGYLGKGLVPHPVAGAGYYV